MTRVKVLRIFDAAMAEDPKDLIWTSILLDLHLNCPLPFLSAMASLRAGIQSTWWKKTLWAYVSTLDSKNSKFCSEADELNDLKKKGMLASTSDSYCESDHQPISSQCCKNGGEDVLKQLNVFISPKLTF